MIIEVTDMSNFHVKKEMPNCSCFWFPMETLPTPHEKKEKCMGTLTQGSLLFMEWLRLTLPRSELEQLT